MKIWTVDAFAKKPFEGNPAAVVVLEAFLSAHMMQAIAAEMNISETTFVVPLSENHFHIRWFSPRDEAPICAHASLAAAHILWEQGFTKAPLLNFESQAGTLLISKHQDLISLNFPVQVTSHCEAPHSLLERVLGVSTNLIKAVYTMPNHYLVELESESDVVTLNPDLMLLKQIPVRALTVTARAQSPYDFVSRYFAPSVGINEDPVCGSAHCRLAPFWAERLGKNDFEAYVASERGGSLKVSLKGDRVILSSAAITVLEGRLLLKI